MQKHSSIFLIVLLVTALVMPGVAAADRMLKSSALCSYEIEKHERLNRIPQQLLKAISVTESGRWHKPSQRVVPWPWTVMAKGEGKFFNSKGQAIAYVMRMKDQGIKNIDVGCMQVNLFYHGDKFANLDEAFNPRTNVGYATQYLTNLKQETRSWTQAVSKYHSNNKKFSQPYRKKVFANWNKEKRYSYEDRRQMLLERYRAKRLSKYYQKDDTPVQTASAE